MMQLRDYQEDLLYSVQAALAEEKARVMMQLPTGGGKTIIAGALLKKWLKGSRKAVWLTHRKELVSQTREQLVEADVASKVDARWTPGHDAPARRNGVAILMAQTVSRRTARMDVWRKYGSDDLMIVDEAHHAAADGWTRAMRQWPGRILGMTATPWRLSHKEGFDHLFSALLCGSQIVDLQSGNHLCDVQVRIPTPQWIVRGGAVDMTGEYSDAGIEAANQDRPDVMTAGALRFWQEQAQDRQTIVYAVSVNHANNLVKVFRNAGVPAAAMLGDTKEKERAALIAGFKRGILQVLVNVAVATEGFDLPDASCVVITRPTKSLTLYLQMVGRGLRPKEDNGNCLILDLAANAETHGLPADEREWSLEPREAQEADGDSLVVRCDQCGTVSPAASHTCQNCGAPFGKNCNRCGKWRAWKRWSLEKQCGDAHELVCDLCHRDTHIEAHLPIDEQLETALAELEDEEAEVPIPGHIKPDDDLDNRILGLLGEMLGQERLKVAGADEERQHELRTAIEKRETQLADESLLEDLFEDHIAHLPVNQRPESNLQKYRMFPQWEDHLRLELGGWKDELAQLESKPIDRQLILDRAKDRAAGLWRRAAQDIDLLPHAKDSVDKPVSRKKVRRRTGKASRNSRLSMDAESVKTLATHSEEIKAEARRLWDEGQTAKQIAVVLFHQGFGTKAGNEFGSGQVASWLPKRKS
ncbi:MAG: DEAD/DEAH box helicase family protein [Caldilineaceae bacterium]|nr:DEAD/DEAH box helicase family protein [Caldilineaceae bacterium]